MKTSEKKLLNIGWATADITPDKPVFLAGQSYARVSEGVLDKITATVLALESVEDGKTADYAIIVSCDAVDAVVGATIFFSEEITANLKSMAPEIEASKILISATHTHTSAEMRLEEFNAGGGLSPDIGIPFEEIGDVMPPKEYCKYAAKIIAEAIASAWQNRKPGGIGYGLGFAVVGRNRRISYYNGEAQMYGDTTTPDFSHIEGYEDHAVNILATYNNQKKLTGVVINIACPSQVSETLFSISADFWHDTREKIKGIYGKDIFILPQCSAAGDQSPHVLFAKKAEARMLFLKGFAKSLPEKIVDSNLGDGMALRKEIADRIATAVEKAMPVISRDINFAPLLRHRKEEIELTLRHLTEEDVKKALNEANKWQAKYEELKKELEANPKLKEEKHWYVKITSAYRVAVRKKRVAERFENYKKNPKQKFYAHFIRLGDIAFASNPFELFLDYGIQIKARSPAIQTFVVQLSYGRSSDYLPTERATIGRSYGATPSSTIVGYEGGKELVEITLSTLNELWR
jgi:hypothetical protein